MKKIISSTLVLLAVITSGRLHAQEKNMKTPEENYKKWYPEYSSTLDATDPELSSIFKNFAFGETQQYGNLDIKTRIIVTMASTIAQHTPAEYRKALNAAYSNGITPLEIKEVLYHAVPYVGMPKVAELIEIANDFLKEKAIKLPLEPQAVVNENTRLEKGLAFQKTIFGSQIDKLYQTSPADQLHLQKYLSANCFGDYQTRPVFDVKMRELLTFSMLISLGGAESQVKGHVQGNLNVGNDRQTLLAVTTQLLPYIGYPRTLNAVTCINEIIPDKK
jgi:4-carboxymuconolactone decarboxylase